MGWLENKPYENIFDEGSSTQDFTKDHQTSVSLTFKKSSVEKFTSSDKDQSYSDWGNVWSRPSDW